jgi:hypothetical protein
MEPMQVEGIEQLRELIGRVIEEAGEPAVIVTLTDASWSSESRHMAHAARRS